MIKTTVRLLFISRGKEGGGVGEKQHKKMQVVGKSSSSWAGW